MEETGLRILQTTLLFNEELTWNKCRYGGDSHLWYLYSCECEPGTPLLSAEIESIGWYSLEEARKLQLVPIADFFLNHIITS